MSPDAVSTDLKSVLRRLKLGRLLDTLPERLALARQQKMPYQEFLLVVLQDEATRRDTQAVSVRAEKARLHPSHQIDKWDETANVTFDHEALNEFMSLRFLESQLNLTLVGPVGVGKTFLAHAIGHAACRRGHSVLAIGTDQMLKTLKQARVLNTYEVELRKLITVDLLILDDFALDAMDAQESRDAYDLFNERHRSGSMIVTSNRGTDEWLPAFADPMRAQSALDRFVSSTYDLVIEGESYRSRQKPRLPSRRS